MDVICDNAMKLVGELWFESPLNHCTSIPKTANWLDYVLKILEIYQAYTSMFETESLLCGFQ